MREAVVLGVQSMVKDWEKPGRSSASTLWPRKELNESETRISQRFVVAKHLKAIGLACKMMNVAVSFRESGEPTVKRQIQGAATKDHSILEKTIKLSSLKNGYGSRANDVLAQLQAADIDGYAGHWDQDEKLLGIHLGPEAMTHKVLKDRIRFAETDAAGQGSKPFYPIDLDSLETSLAALKSVSGWNAIPITGDNDTHDMISFSSRRAPVPQGSDLEKKIIATLNAAVAAIDPLRPVDKPHKHVVQHGPQQSYPAFMFYEEKQRELVESVAWPSFPLAMCSKGEWSEIKGPDEHEAFYDSIGLPMKSTWRDPEQGFERTGPGRVVLRRSSSGGSAGSGTSGSERSMSASELRVRQGEAGQGTRGLEGARRVSEPSAPERPGQQDSGHGGPSPGRLRRSDTSTLPRARQGTSAGPAPQGVGHAAAIQVGDGRTEAPSRARPLHMTSVRGGVEPLRRELQDISETGEESTEHEGDPLPGSLVESRPGG